jgi:hypothetical protein
MSCARMVVFLMAYGFYNDLIKLLCNNAQQEVDFTGLSSRQVFVDSLKKLYLMAEPVVYKNNL